MMNEEMVHHQHDRDPHRQGPPDSPTPLPLLPPPSSSSSAAAESLTTSSHDSSSRRSADSTTAGSADAADSTSASVSRSTSTSTTRRRRDVMKAVAVVRRGGSKTTNYNHHHPHHQQQPQKVQQEQQPPPPQSATSVETLVDSTTPPVDENRHDDHHHPVVAGTAFVPSSPLKQPTQNSRNTSSHHHRDPVSPSSSSTHDQVVMKEPPSSSSSQAVVVNLTTYEDVIDIDIEEEETSSKADAVQDERRLKTRDDDDETKQAPLASVGGLGTIKASSTAAGIVGYDEEYHQSVTIYDGVDYGSSGSESGSCSGYGNSQSFNQNQDVSSRTTRSIQEYEGVDYSDNNQHDGSNAVVVQDQKRHQFSSPSKDLSKDNAAAVVGTVHSPIHIVDAIIEEETDEEEDEEEIGQVERNSDQKDVSILGGHESHEEEIEDGLPNKAETTRSEVPTSCDIPTTVVATGINGSSTIASSTDLGEDGSSGQMINFDSTSDDNGDPDTPNDTSKAVDLLIQAVGDVEDDDDDEDELDVPDISGGLGSDRSSLLHFESSESSKGSQGSYADQVPALSGSASTNNNTSHSQRATEKERNNEIDKSNAANVQLVNITPPPPPPPPPPPRSTKASPPAKIVVTSIGAPPLLSHQGSRSSHRSASHAALQTPTTRTRTYHTAEQTLSSSSDDLEDILGHNGEPVPSDLDDILGERPGNVVGGTNRQLSKQSSLEDTLGPYQGDDSADNGQSNPIASARRNMIPTGPPNKEYQRPVPAKLTANIEKLPLSRPPPSPASMARTPSESRRAIEGITKALAERRADDSSSAWSPRDGNTGMASILPEPSTVCDETTAYGEDSTAMYSTSRATSYEDDEDDKSNSWGRSGRSRYTTATSMSQSHFRNETLSPTTIDSSMRDSRGVGATPSSRPDDSRFTFSQGTSTFRTDDDVSPSATGHSYYSHSTSRRSGTETGTRFSRMTMSSHPTNLLAVSSTETSSHAEDTTHFTEYSITQRTEQSTQGMPSRTSLSVGKSESSTKLEATHQGRFNVDVASTEGEKEKCSQDAVDHTDGNHPDDTGDQDVHETVDPAQHQQTQQENNSRPLSPRAQKFAESIKARTRSRADPDALVGNVASGTVQNGDEPPRNNMVKLTTNDEGLIESTAFARKRVGAAQLLSVGLASFLIAFMGGFWAQSSCYFVSSLVEVADNGGDFLMRFGMWKYSPVESISEGYSYCSPYATNMITSLWLGRMSSLLALFGGLFSLIVLWIYLVLGRSNPRTWNWAILTAGSSGVLQLSTVISVFTGPVCSENGCSPGPASIVSVIGGLMYFALAYEMHYNRPVFDDSIGDLDDSLFSSRSPGQRSQSIVANLEMTDFEDGAKAYVQRLSYGNSDACNPSSDEVHYQHDYHQQEDMGTGNKNGSYEPPSAIV